MTNFFPVSSEDTIRENEKKTLKLKMIIGAGSVAQWIGCLHVYLRSIPDTQYDPPIPSRSDHEHKRGVISPEHCWVWPQ